jgi:hypothetical protein
MILSPSREWSRAVLLLSLLLMSSGCEAIGDIFQAGVWLGAIVVLLILGVIGFIAAKLRRG